MKRIGNLHRFHDARSSGERERKARCTADAVDLLRKARQLVEFRGFEPLCALSEVWDRRDPYGAIAVAGVAVGRALPPPFLDVDAWARRSTKAEVLDLFDRAIAGLLAC